MATQLGDKIRQARHAACMTQLEASLKICSGKKDTYRSYEYGNRKPPHAVLKKMARAFRVPMAYFHVEP